MARVKVNLTLDAEVADTARTLGLNMSRLAEAAISDAARLEKNRRWRAARRYVALSGLTPSIEVDGTEWIVRVQELATVPGAELGAPIGSLAGHRDALKRALDILIDGV